MKIKIAKEKEIEKKNERKRKENVHFSILKAKMKKQKRDVDDDDDDENNRTRKRDPYFLLWTFMLLPLFDTLTHTHTQLLLICRSVFIYFFSPLSFRSVVVLI